MDAQKILTADLDDLVFEGRNKSYGAYFLRKNYSKHLMWALLISLGIYLMGFGGPYIYALMNPPAPPAPKKKITVTDLSPAPPIDESKTPPPPPPQIPPPPTTLIFTPLIKTY